MRKAGIPELHVLTAGCFMPAAYLDAQAWHAFDAHVDLLWRHAGLHVATLIRTWRQAPSSAWLHMHNAGCRLWHGLLVQGS